MKPMKVGGNMGTKQPNDGLKGLLAETGWSETQLAREVNRVGSKAGTPLHYSQSSVSHWLTGTMPKKQVRVFVWKRCPASWRGPSRMRRQGFQPKAHPLPTSTPLKD